MAKLGYDLSAPDYWGKTTPLSLAVQAFSEAQSPGQADQAARLIESLLETGCRLDQANPDRKARQQYPTLADLLVSNPEALAFLAISGGATPGYKINVSRTEQFLEAVAKSKEKV